MRVIDLHCDALMKLLRFPLEEFSCSTKLDVTLEELIKGNYLLQVFAIYIPEEYPKNISSLMRVIDLFYSKVINHPQMHWVRSKEDLEYCLSHKKIGALLSIEGVECLEAKLYMTSILQKLGIQAIGLTWNNQNWAAEGVLANTKSGISQIGKQFIKKLEVDKIILDVSHLSPTSFSDLLVHYSGPIWASHSNSYALCPHPRNLTDEQLFQLADRGGIIGVTYVPQFISEYSQATIDKLISHIDYLIELGVEKHIALGSDFDGIDFYVEGLAQPSDVNQLANALLIRYGKEISESILWKNAYQFLYQYLP